jgi:hypothetical protein
MSLELRDDGSSAGVPRLQKGSSPPEEGVLMDFARFKAASSNGKISESISTEALITFFRQFFAGWTRISGVEVSKEVIDNVYDVSEGEVSPSSICGSHRLVH